jgi:hypothetical protein
MGYCNLPDKTVGPYNQTLFLGCSVTNFNCNLGWGADQSTLNVSLSEDYCYHPQSNEYSPDDIKLQTLTQQPDDVTGGTAFHKENQGNYKYDDPTKALHKNMAFQVKDLEDIRDAENTTLHEDIKDYGKVCHNLDNEKTYWKDPDPGFLGLPNKFHPSGYDILGTPVRFKFHNFTFGGLISSWKQAGSQGGIRQYEVEIKSFSSLLNGCQLIIGGYAGTVCGLLAGTAGADVNGTVNITQKLVAMPTPYVADLSTDPPTFLFDDHRARIEQGNLPNVINVHGYLHFKGLQQKVYGNSRINENGMKGTFIYDAINMLIGLGSINNTDAIGPFSPYGGLLCRKIVTNGEVLDVDPINVQLNGGGASINLTHMGICHVGNDPLISGLKKSRLLLDISEVPRPPYWYRIQGPVISLMQFITEMCDGFGFDFFVDFVPPDAALRAANYSGIIKIRTVSRRTQPKKDNIAALISKLSTSDPNKTQDQIRIELLSFNAQKNALITQINTIQGQLDGLYTNSNKGGYLSDEWRNDGAIAYNEAIENGQTHAQAIQALQRAYNQGQSINQQKTTLSQQMTDLETQLSTIQTNINQLLAGGGGLSSYSYGKEFTDTNTRSMYIGGKQKRLLQLRATRLCYKQNTLIYDPFANNGDGSLIDYDALIALDSIPNQVRFPNLFSTRRYYFKIFNGCAVTSNSLDFNTQGYFTTPRESMPLVKGNYGAAFSYATEAFQGTVGNLNANVALMDDAICPYFGVGANGLIRPVYFDKNMGQMQIIFQTQDIQDLTSLPLAAFNPYSAAGLPTATTNSSPIFLVLENEVRAAGGGFASWLNYCFNNVFTTDIAELIYKGFRDKYGFGSIQGPIAMFNTPKNEFIMGITSIIALASNKNVDAQGKPRPVNLESLAPYFKTLYHDLSKIHQFFQNIANEYYGKQFMITIPEIAWYRDYEYSVNNNNQLISLGTDDSGNIIYAIEGTGKVYTNYQVSTDGAWEEPGNFIDDTMIVGGSRATFFADETGKIPPLFGFNATIEKDYSRKWKRKKYLDYISRYINFEGFLVGNLEFALERMLNDPELQDMNHYYLNLEHQLSPEEHMMMPYEARVLPIPMAHGEIAPTNGFFTADNDLGRHKLYAKATVSDQLQFLGPNNTQPRAIMQLSSPVFIGNGKNTTEKITTGAMIQDSLLKLIRGSSVPQVMKSNTPFGNFGGFGGGDNTLIGGLGNNWWINSGDAVVFAKKALEYQYAHNCTTSNNIDGTEGSIHPQAIDMLGKTAIPMFCAIPLEFNDFVYGPWINHPGLIRNIIFPDTTDINIHSREVENLIGGVKVQIDESLVPWNYGGMTALDDAVMTKITDDVNYQQTLEQGTVQIPTFDNFNLGDILSFYGGVFGGPTINSIQVQIGQGGITTTYNFRTYIRKLGLFNKENAERIKSINQESLKRNKELTNKLVQLISKLGSGPAAIRLF